MCGIIGYSGKTGFNPDKIKLLFLYNQSRGEDSAGFYTNFKDEKWEDRVERVLGKASEKLLPKYCFNTESKNSNLLIGHVRKKSVGSAANVNQAHPFTTPNYVGVHNGTFRNWKDVAKAFEIKGIDVDSHVFYEVLEQVKNPWEAIGYFEGGAALVFTSKEEENTMYVYRNTERELYRGTMKDENGDRQIYMSSMEDALIAIGCNNIQIFKPDRIYKITDGNVECLMNKIIKKDLPIPSFQSEADDFEIVRVINRKREEIDAAYKDSHQRLFKYSDDAYASGFTSDFIGDINRELIIYRKKVNKYFYRCEHKPVHGRYPAKIFEVALPTDLFGTNSGSENVSNMALDEELEGVVNFMYRIYGELNSYQVYVEDLLKRHKIETSENTLENVLNLMNSFMGISTQ